ncbi:MAG: class I SAM-dependent methyltransferase [Acidobacteria bacterium]|nr:MAG: class I SAM-dependent methyltransferase [Acidobacteriota bacterium]
MNSLSEPLAGAADRWQASLRTGDVSPGMVAIAAALTHTRTSMPADEWRALTSSGALDAWRALAHQCPYTDRGYRKPRGYAGDAVLLDYIYGSAPAPDGTSPSGRAMLQWMRRESEGFRSVRWRREYFAKRIDMLAAERPGARVASIACGHFREGLRSLAVRQGGLGDVIAFDHDPDSLDVVASDQSAFGVRPVQGSVRDLVTGKARVEGMDLIYAAGLYDYLADPFARRLTKRLFDGLQPRGTLIVANFVRMWERGWMEAFMDWWLIYRDHDEVASLSSEIDPALIKQQRVFADPSGCVAYLEIRKV